MFEPLSDVIRLRRLQRNLTQERLAKLAGVSRRQLSLMEDGANVSLLFLTKIARVLELNEIPVGELRLKGSQPELETIVRAAEVLERLQQVLPQLEGMAEEIRTASASLDDLLERAITSGVSTRDIEGSAEQLARLPAGERHAAAETLRQLARSDPSARAARPKAAAKAAAAAATPKRRGR
jgi:transcriptional regulator with XRE-family HTH domain